MGMVEIRGRVRTLRKFVKVTTRGQSANFKGLITTAPRRHTSHQLTGRSNTSHLLTILNVDVVSNAHLFRRSPIANALNTRRQPSNHTLLSKKTSTSLFINSSSYLNQNKSHSHPVTNLDPSLPIGIGAFIAQVILSSVPSDKPSLNTLPPELSVLTISK